MAETSAGGEAKGTEGGGKKGLGFSKLGPLLLAVLNLSAMGGGGFLIYKSTLGFERPSIREEIVFEEMERESETADETQALLFSMDKFTVNLTGSPRRVMQIEMSLEMLDKEGFEEVVTLGPQARDAIVRILNGKEYLDVETIQGKLFLKDQIALALNEHLTKGVVKDIYFSEFLVQ